MQPSPGRAVGSCAQHGRAGLWGAVSGLAGPWLGRVVGSCAWLRGAMVYPGKAVVCGVLGDVLH